MSPTSALGIVLVSLALVVVMAGGGREGWRAARSIIAVVVVILGMSLLFYWSVLRRLH
jgi:hypothetical protein